MEDQAPIRSALERNVKVVSARPSVGQGVAVTRATLGPGLSCEVTEGPWRLAVGMTEKYGGTNIGPNPGVYGRGALASCLVIGYSMWAARLGVPLTSLSVEVHASYDVRGELGIDADVRPGYGDVKCVIAIESDAPEADVRRLAEIAERHSSWLDDFRHPVPVTTSLMLNRVALA